MTVSEAINQLQALDMNNPGAWPRWAHIGSVILAVLVIVGFGIWIGVKPQYEVLGIEEQKELELRTEFERKQKKVAALDAYKAQLETMERDFGAMLRQLPSKTEVENLLNDISQTRVASSLEEELFEPQSESPKDFYAEVPNRIIVTGDYHEMGAFVGGVAALPRIVTIDEVEITPAASDRGQSAFPKGTLRLRALAKTYRYLDASEIVTPADPKAAGARPARPARPARGAP